MSFVIQIANAKMTKYYDTYTSKVFFCLFACLFKHGFHC